jgi:hypothetical protein
MNRIIYLSIFGFLGLLVFLTSGSSAASRCVPQKGCDCDEKNIGGCNATGIIAVGVACGRDIDCNRLTDRFLVNTDD